MDACELAAAVRDRQVSPVEAVEDALDALDDLDGRLNAFAVTFPEQARREAHWAERRAAEPDPPPLLGVPISVKDHIWMRDAPATNGSEALRDFVPDADCELVRRLRDAGAIIIGKTNNPEFLYRSYAGNGRFYRTRNPWDLSRTPGGSSGGSAAAVATGIGALSVGTDAGGSIRTPASFCGVVGHKPTFGLVPRLPGFRGFPSLSVNGPMGRTVRDAMLMLSVMAGVHRADYLSVPGPSVSLDDAAAEDGDLRDVRIAVTDDMGLVSVDDEVRQALAAAVAALRGLGLSIRAGHPQADAPEELWWRIATCEMHASEGPLLERFEHEMTPGTAAIIRSGARFSASQYLDALQARLVFAGAWASFFEDFDVLLSPSVPVPAFTIGTDHPTVLDGVPYEPLSGDWCSMAYPANLTNQPALSVPIGFSSDGMPIGMQIITRRFEDRLALRVGAAWERVSPWTNRRPPIAASSDQTAHT